MKDYKQSSLYQLGAMHCEFGRLLMDPSTELTTLCDFAEEHGFVIQFSMSPATANSSAAPQKEGE